MIFDASLLKDKKPFSFENLLNFLVSNRLKSLDIIFCCGTLTASTSIVCRDASASKTASVFLATFLEGAKVGRLLKGITVAEPGFNTLGFY